jgi:hypothetical protein
MHVHATVKGYQYSYTHTRAHTHTHTHTHTRAHTHTHTCVAHARALAYRHDVRWHPDLWSHESHPHRNDMTHILT